MPSHRDSTHALASDSPSEPQRSASMSTSHRCTSKLNLACLPRNSTCPTSIVSNTTQPLLLAGEKLRHVGKTFTSDGLSVWVRGDVLFVRAEAPCEGFACLPFLP